MLKLFTYTNILNQVLTLYIWNVCFTIVCLWDYDL